MKNLDSAQVKKRQGVRERNLLDVNPSGVAWQKSAAKGGPAAVGRRRLAYITLPVGLLVFFAGVFAPTQLSFQSVGTAEVTPIFRETTAAASEFSSLPLVPQPAERYILVSLADQRLQVYDHGSQVMAATVSTGSARLPTPKGEFHLLNKAPRAYSKVAKLMMPYWMAFNFRQSDQHYLGFHDLPEYADGRKEGLEHLGLPYSGGCIRLNTAEAKRLYDWAQVGDLVIVY